MLKASKSFCAEHSCKMQGASNMAYPSVVAGGPSATVIHYGENNQASHPPAVTPSTCLSHVQGFLTFPLLQSESRRDMRCGNWEVPQPVLLLQQRVLVMSCVADSLTEVNL